MFAQDEIMRVITPGSHGSTFGGNPLAAKVAIETLRALEEEDVIENAKVLGERFRSELRANLPEDVIPVVRGRGLMNAVCLHAGNVPRRM